jgi:hypothetical protein
MGFWASDRKTPAAKSLFWMTTFALPSMNESSLFTLYPHPKQRAFQQKRRDPGRGPVDHPAGWA